MDNGYGIHTFQFKYLRARLKGLRVYLGSWYHIYDGTLTSYIQWSYHQWTLITSWSWSYVLLRVDITSTGHYYKTIWILINGTHILDLFNIYWWCTSQPNKTISSSDVAITIPGNARATIHISNYASFVRMTIFPSYYCITCMTHVCHVVCHCMLLFIAT